MTSNSLHNKLRTRILLALIIIGLLCTSMFLFTACGTSTTEKDPSYSYTDTDDGLISNPSFSFGTADIELKNYPQTSPTGWSRSKDSEGKASSAKSGVIDLSTDGWKAVMNSLYSDSYYFDYLLSKGKVISKTDAKAEIIKKNGDPEYKPTNEEIKTYIVEEHMLKKVDAPTIRTGAEDNKVYMLNNYTSNINWGASQKITASKSVTIEAGEYVKFSVYIKTQNLNGLNGSNKMGASIRLSSTFNGSSQAEYAITNIVSNDAWQQYTVYAKGDANYPCTVTLALGLGYNVDYQTEGTAYFDDVEVEHLTSIPNDVQISNFSYNSEDAIINEYTPNTSYLYDMTMDKDTSYNQVISPALSGEYTKFNNEQAGNKFGSADTSNLNNGVITLTNASYSVKIENSLFTVAPESYAYLSFTLDNQLSKFGSTAITVDIWEKVAGREDTKYANVAQITEEGENSVGLMLKNNFDKDEYTTERTFYVVLVIGPTNNSDVKADFASGTVTIKDFEVAKGVTYQYDNNDIETPNYKLYQLYSNTANATTSLYGGFTGDYVEGSDSTTVNGFEVSNAQISAISRQPIAAEQYFGVTTDSIYLKKDGTDASPNNRNPINGYAGVVDTQYNYTDSANGFNISALNGEENLRPLMIYNAISDSYGFIGSSTKTISENSFAKVTVQLKVTDGAKAYVYLTSKTASDWEITSFEEFKPNTDGINYISSENQSLVSNRKLFIEIDYNKYQAADKTDGWMTVEFYVATGNTQKSFRLELWNGSRDGANKSQGYVFFKSVNVSLSNGFSEPAGYKEAFNNENSPLFAKDLTEFFCYQRELTNTEKQFNNEYPDNKVSYSKKVVWAKNDSMVYAIFNNLDVAEVDPYDSIEDNGDSTGSGCTAQTDPSTFWLSFSSIVLAAVLVLAIVMLFVKNIRRRHKANASDAKSHYTVKSRVRTNKVKAEKIVEEKPEEMEETTKQELETTEQAENIEENSESASDDYIYGDVQDFGDEDKNN